MDMKLEPTPSELSIAEAVWKYVAEDNIGT
jgi:hypothetical protein